MRVLLANVSIWRGEPDTALEYTTKARAMFEELGDAWGQLQAIGPMVLALNATMRPTEARALVDVADRVGERVSDVAMQQIPTVLRVAILIQAGDPQAYPAAERMAAELSRMGDRFLGDEQRTLWGLAQLQHGDVSAAVETLQEAVKIASTRGPAAAASVAYAAALVAAGDAEQALQLCADTEELVVTFVDHYRLELARAFALHRAGDTDGARAAFQRAASVVDPTHSRLDQFVVRLARAAFESASAGTGTAPPLEQRSIGWERAFALMAGTPG
jgi:tetratricopeptide (TPR) repeat protein